MGEKEIDERINQLVQKALSTQWEDGAFRLCFENSLLTDAMMIVLIRTLELHEERILENLVGRILTKQSRVGCWKLYDDEEGNLSATVLAYHSLLFSGKVSRDQEQMKRAERYIMKWGGIEQSDSMTKVFLALNGHMEWPRLCHFPMLFMLVPEFFPVSFYDLSSYARIHFAPIILTQDLRYSIRTKWTPDLTHLKGEERSLHETLSAAWDTVVNFPSHQLYKARKRAEHYMFARIEEDGTLFNYATATFFMIYALLALGYEKHSSAILHAMSGLKRMLCLSDSHLQNSPSTVWDTALLSSALQDAGLSKDSVSIVKANEFLQCKQHSKIGDWVLTKPDVVPGGWGFSEGNTIHPDVDDTTAALRAVGRNNNPEDWQRGVNWVLAMQNRDGGWPAFEPDRHALLLKELPIDGARSSFPDNSTADLTGRTVEFLCNYANFEKDHPAIEKAIKWLIMNQRNDGSWYGRWGVCYVYGTWASLTGLRAAGLSMEHPTVQKGIRFLKNIQREDGGWGESCKSDEQKRYVPLSYSTPSQSAWAVHALTVCGDKSKVLKKGVDYLSKRTYSERELTYPTGAGLPGGFYIRYHSYEIIWPLLALTHYKKMFSHDLEV
ncbi:MAG: prenyltransferase/squalene oxidase repeat-containing protein [Anaerobacillus sp.]